MALLDSEIARLKAELGYNLLNVGAEPYIGITSLFSQIIKPYLSSGAITTSSTAVTQQSAPTAIALTLASATGFSQFDRVVVDVDGAQETASVRAISGSAITVLLSGAHSGTYPVTVEGGEAIVRENLGRILGVKTQMATVLGEGQLKKVDEVEFYQSPLAASSSLGGGLFATLAAQLTFWRDELASCLGIQSMWKSRQSAGSRMSVY
jgi:hypothetical protein